MTFSPYKLSQPSAVKISNHPEVARGMTYGSFPALNEYLAMRAMFQYFGRDFAPLPPITEEMLTWGEAKSPEYACLPFKIYVAFFRELARRGVMKHFVYGTRSIRACRYMDLWEGVTKIVRREGYPDFTVYYWGGFGLKKSFEALRRVMGGPSYPKMLMGILVYCATLHATDRLNDLANTARPREVIGGSVDRWLNHWLKKLEPVNRGSQARRVVAAAQENFQKIKLDQKRSIIKVTLAGDLFKIHEPFFHFDTIRKLNRLGVEVKQPQSFSLLFMGGNKILPGGYYHQQFVKFQKKSKKYLKSIPGSYFDVGIGEIIDQLEQGAKGIVHFQSFGCMPDIMFKPILDRIAKDFNVPIIHYMRDTHASDTAYQTRLEAFTDLLKRKELNNENSKHHRFAGPR